MQITVLALVISLFTFALFCVEVTVGQNRNRQPYQETRGRDRERDREGSSTRCVLDDAQRTQGRCINIRQCTHAIGRLRAGTSVKICPGGQNEIVCCPTEHTKAEKKCEEWEQVLRQPEFFGHSSYQQPTCAFTQIGFIVGGRDAHAFEFPHSVALGFGNSQSSAKYECGATLIDSMYLVTAAHCVKSEKGPPRWALIGDITLQRQTVPYRKVVSIVEWIIHPDYRPPLTYNDIAVLKLGERLDVSRYILPACLGDPTTTPTSANVVATGWGLLGAGERQSDILQAVNLTIVKAKECNSYFSDNVEKRIRYPQGLVKSQLCAGDTRNGEKDTCNGDSGGGITVNPKIPCLYHLVGVTSFGSKLCGYGQPGVYTKILSHVDWIERTIWN